MMHVLWLASWYPGRRDAFTGDFIERQALAVSRYAKVTLLVILKDDQLAVGKVETEKNISGNLTVYRVYYGKSRWPVFIESILSVKKYFSLQKKLFHQIESEVGRPLLVLVQVAMKAGLLALWLKKKYQLPYVVTEHWTGYYPISRPSVYQYSFIYRWFNKRVLKNAALFLPVTNDLGETVNKNFLPVQFQPLPNVVNTDLFFYNATPPPVFRFIHPSVMNYQKNPEGIVAACLQLKNMGYQFELLMAGNNSSELEKIVADAGLLDSVVFVKPAIAYEAVAAEMRQSSALLLFSRFENLPCVILEALCCGLPVISSRVGGIAEIIDSTNGILVATENVSELVKAMQQLIDQYTLYNREAIAEKACRQFSFDMVGSQYFSVYQNVLQHG